MTGLRISVYRDHTGDCTGGGASAKRGNFVLVDESINAPFEVEEGEPYLKIVKRFLAGRDYFHLEPVFPDGKEPNEIGPMFGGNFGYCSDSRFPFDYPLPIHDRWESQKVYDSLSR